MEDRDVSLLPICLLMDGKLPYHVPFFISAKRKSANKCGISTKRRSSKKSAVFTKHLSRAKKGHGVINFRILNFFTPCGVNGAVIVIVGTWGGFI